MNRNDVAELIVAARIQKGVKWADAPYKGSPPTAVPTDPLIYRFYSRAGQRLGNHVQGADPRGVGDGIMSAIDFRRALRRESDPAGDRVNIVMSGKFPPYKTC